MQPEPSSATEVAGTPPTIVIVDDSADVRTLVRTQIRLSGRFEVIGEGVNGLDAVALVSRHRPDLLLLDVSMPVIDGLAALPKVREASPATRVVMYSGFDEAGLASRARELGATAFVSKSAPFDVLLATLAEQLEQAGDAPAEQHATRAGDRLGSRASHPSTLSWGRCGQRESSSMT